jgi:hypothetical protein
MVRRREECRPLAPGIPTVHARTPINTDLSRKLCAIAAAGETPANGAANGSMHGLRAILNNPMAISPNTDPSLSQGRERVGASTQEYRPLTQESAVRASKIQTFRIGNADLSRKGYRPFAQRIPTFRAKNTDLSRKGLPTAGARDYRLPAQERRRIQTSRTSNTDLSRKAAPGNTCKSMHFADRLPFPCCSCLCLMFCCRKKSGG